MKKSLKNTILAAMFLGLALVLPFLTGQIKSIGNMLLPMHIPVMLCGLICGKYYGLAVGFITPLVRSVLFGMPHMYPNAVSMAFELATYGFVIGLLYYFSHYKCVRSLLRCMIYSMIAGRIVWGLVQFILLGGGAFTLKMFFAGAVVNAIPGIIIQLVLIPSVMVGLGRAKLVPFAGSCKKNGKQI